MYITLTCCPSFSFKFVANLWWRFLLGFSAELRASRGSGTKWRSCEVGCRYSLCFLFLILLKGIGFPHSLVAFMCCYMKMNCSVLKFEYQIMNLFLQSNSSRVCPCLIPDTSRTGTALTTSGSWRLHHWHLLSRVYHLKWFFLVGS